MRRLIDLSLSLLRIHMPEIDRSLDCLQVQAPEGGGGGDRALAAAGAFAVLFVVEGLHRHAGKNDEF